jgi:Holliday junction resolvase-like predicted endonuclease
VIYNKRFTFNLKEKKGEQILDAVTDFFQQKLNKKQYPLRYAIVAVNNKKITIDATILEQR